MLVAPGIYTVRVSASDGTNTNFVEVVVTVMPEDADVTYTGDMLAFTAPGGTTASVLLRATILDAGDGYPGDIRNATVTFKKDSTTLCGPLPVLLINGLPTIGSVECSVTLGLDDHTIDIYVNGYYVGTGSGVVEVAVPDGSFITGGGYIVQTASAGSYAASPGSKANFGFNIKYNKKMTNLQGHLNLIFRRTVAGQVRTYQVKSTATSSLGIALKTATGGLACSGPPSATCWGLADFRTKANLTDVTNPLAPVSLGGGLTMHVTMTDKGEPGAFDSIGFTLWDGSTLLFSSNWSGTKTTEKVLTGGNLVVH